MEIDLIVSSGSVDGCIQEGVLYAIQVSEVVALQFARTDIRSLAMTLKNPEFVKVKHLSIKYCSFSAIPFEYKLMFIIFSTAYAIRAANQAKLVQSQQAPTQDV